MAFGFGIIGCGMIANFHAKAIADVKGAKLVACFDTFTSAADKLAETYGCKAYHKLEDMLADPKVNAVTIGTAFPGTRNNVFTQELEFLGTLRARVGVDRQQFDLGRRSDSARAFHRRVKQFVLHPSDQPEKRA